MAEDQCLGVGDSLVGLVAQRRSAFRRLGVAIALAAGAVTLAGCSTGGHAESLPPVTLRVPPTPNVDLAVSDAGRHHIGCDHPRRYPGLGGAGRADHDAGPGCVVRLSEHPASDRLGSQLGRGAFGAATEPINGVGSSSAQ